MSNLHLFGLLNARPGLSGWHLTLALALAKDLVFCLPLVMAWAWVAGNHASRRELLHLLLSAAMALALAQVVSHVWPQPRPFALHLGTQYLAHGNDPGLPSDPVTLFWSLAIAAFMTRRFALWALPLLTAGLIVGWSRVYLGVHFPFDVLAALPVAALGATIAKVLRRPCLPATVRMLSLYDRLARWLRAALPQKHTQKHKHKA